MKKKNLVTKNDGEFIDRYLDIDIKKSLNYAQMFGRQVADIILNLYLYTDAGLIVSDMRKPYFQAFCEGVSGRVSLVCKRNGSTFYLHRDLEKTLLENDENLKVHEDVLMDIKRRSRKKRATDRNSDGYSDKTNI
uniref:DNA-binding protein n=1 Tax=Strongyloides venezuelensis TaxID=75913 RepID=A0A0K0G2E9_STRVS